MTYYNEWQPRNDRSYGPLVWVICFVLALLLLMFVPVGAAHALTVTISTSYLPDNGSFVEGLSGQNDYWDDVIGGTVHMQANSGSGVFRGTDSVVNQHLSPGTQYSAYLASASGFGSTIHLYDDYPQQATGFQLEIGSIDSQLTTGSGTNWICAGEFCLSGADLIGYVPSWDLGRDLSLTVTGLDPFSAMTFSNSPSSVLEVAALSIIRTGGIVADRPVATPELSTLAMVLIGFIALGYAAIRKTAKENREICPGCGRHFDDCDCNERSCHAAHA